MTSGQQLALPFTHLPHYGREDFWVGPANAAALAYLERWPQWLAAGAVLVGPEGSGKTHLAALFARHSGALVMRADHLGEVDLLPLRAGQALALEDADRFPVKEQVFFHALNLARERGFSLLITARTPPDQWGVALPDLHSRLRAQPLLTLAAPDEALLANVLVKHFADRQIKIAPNLVAYILARMERSYGAVRDLVCAIDAQAMAQHRKITRAMLAELLGAQLDGEGEADADL